MSIAIREWKSLNEAQRREILERSEADISEAEETVAEIIKDVRLRGDEALIDYSRKFDKADISELGIEVEDSEFDRAANILSGEVKSALDYAVENVKRFHEAQRPSVMEYITIRPGITAGERPSPIDSVGLYVPRGRGSFPSMLYMLAVPAVIAGVPRISIVTPPLPDGSVDPACLYAARLCGVEKVYRCGGAQAIAALAYGTESVEPVVKVVGPGSRYVTAAKRLLSRRIDPGPPAGPSESIILADASADAYTVALDLLIEAEHGSDSAALLITDDMGLAGRVKKYVDEYLPSIPEPRRTYIRDVFAGYGGIIIADDMDEAIDLVNDFATEHLQVQSEDPSRYLPRLRNAGEILLGSGVPFSIANYAVGPNAVLPTGGRAKTWSAVSVRDFMKFTSVIDVQAEAYGEIAAHSEVLARYEGFYTHEKALAYRREMPLWAKKRQSDHD